MSEFVNTIDKLGDDVVSKSIVNGTVREFYDDVLTKIGAYAFTQCEELITVDLPNVTVLETVKGEQFSACKKLKSVNLPKANKIAPNCFNGCSELESVNIENATHIGNGTFRGATKLSLIDLPKATSINNQAFYGASILKVVILRSTEVCAIARVDVFQGTPFYSTGTGGTVYVPAALITEYQNATNWSTLYAAGTCNFVAIEGSEYE